MTVSIEAQLIDGGRPPTPGDLFRRLRALNIPFETHLHAPVFTVDEARAVRGHLPGCHTKNLFLRDKKERMWLFVCEAERPLDMRDLADRLGARRVSFGSPQRLMHYLGVIPGAVNPFAVMNDHQRAVRVVLDQAILGNDPLNFHPLDNAMTTAIATEDLLRFLEAEAHPPRILHVPPAKERPA